MPITKRAILYDPYLDTLGGGERYFLTVAEELIKHKYEVTIIWPKPTNILLKAKDRFDIDLKLAKIEYLDITNYSLLKKYLYLSKFDLSFFITDGSLPFLFAKKNYIHAQVPFTKTNSSVLNLVKLFFIKNIICNSRFTQSQTRITYHTNKTVLLYPPIEIINTATKLLPKEKIILSVARFTNQANNKRQDILISAFKKLYKINKEYRLVLVGGNNDPQNQFLQYLKKQSVGYPISFVENPPSKEVINLYKQSEIFWHAAGYGINEIENPEKTEHFGMSIVEAMSYGCLVFGINKGGIKEIITDNINGLFWENEDELIEKTLKYIKSDNINNKIRLNAINYSSKFSRKVFNQSLREILK